MKPLDILKNAAELIVKKGNDYQNPKSRIRQADYYPNGAQTILDIMTGKVFFISISFYPFKSVKN